MKKPRAAKPRRGLESEKSTIVPIATYIAASCIEYKSMGKS